MQLSVAHRNQTNDAQARLARAYARARAYKVRMGILRSTEPGENPEQREAKDDLAESIVGLANAYAVAPVEAGHPPRILLSPGQEAKLAALIAMTCGYALQVGLGEGSLLYEIGANAEPIIGLPEDI